MIFAAQNCYDYSHQKILMHLKSILVQTEVSSLIRHQQNRLILYFCGNRQGLDQLMQMDSFPPDQYLINVLDYSLYGFRYHDH